MPTFHITHSDGSEYEVDAPDEVTAANAVATPDGTAAQAPISTAKDVALSAGSGLLRGAGEALAAPVTLPKMAADAMVGGGDWLVRHMLGMGDAPAAAPEPRSTLNQISSAIDPANVISDLRGAADANLHAPQTIAGHYAQTLGEMAPAIFGGEGGAASRILGRVATPAIASETAGQLAPPEYAPYARVAGGLAGNLPVALEQAYLSAPNKIVSGAVQGVAPQQFDAAQALQQRAAAAGVPLTGPEALQQITGNATRLGDTQRMVEGVDPNAGMAQFFSQRPAQVDAAANQTFDTVSPASAQPSTLGPQAAEAATGAIDQIRRNINDTTRPAYQAAEQTTLAPQDFAPIERDPTFQASLDRLRKDPVLSAVYAGQPDNSIGVIDAVTKDMRDRGVALGNSANPGFSSQTAGLYGSGAAEARDIARDPARGGSQAYDDALAMQEQLRRQLLDPVQQGPTGALAAAGDTQAAHGVLLPRQPLTNGQGELADTVNRISQQDPTVAAPLVRQGLADRFDQATKNLQSGPNQYGGAGYAKDIAGSNQQRANLDAVLGALPNSPGATDNMANLIQILQATGTRKPIGSATSFNNIGLDKLGQLPPVAEALTAAKTAGLSLAPAIRERAAQAVLGNRIGGLADLFTAPDSVQQIANIAQTGNRSVLADLFMRQALQGSNEARPR